MSATASANAGAPAPSARLAVPDWVRGIRPGVALAGLVVAFFVVAMIVPGAAHVPRSLRGEPGGNAPVAVLGTHHGHRPVGPRPLRADRLRRPRVAPDRARRHRARDGPGDRLRHPRRPRQQVGRRGDQPRRRGDVRLPDPPPGPALRRRLRSQRHDRDRRGRARHGPRLRPHGAWSGSRRAGLRLRRGRASARASLRLDRAAAHLPQRDAAAGRRDDARRRPVDRLGLGHRLPRPRRPAALRRSGERSWTPGATTSPRPGGWR